MKKMVFYVKVDCVYYSGDTLAYCGVLEAISAVVVQSINQLTWDRGC